MAPFCTKAAIVSSFTCRGEHGSLAHWSNHEPHRHPHAGRGRLVVRQRSLRAQEAGFGLRSHHLRPDARPRARIRGLAACLGIRPGRALRDHRRGQSRMDLRRIRPDLRRPGVGAAVHQAAGGGNSIPPESFQGARRPGHAQPAGKTALRPSFGRGARAAPGLPGRRYRLGARHRPRRGPRSRTDRRPGRSARKGQGPAGGTGARRPGHRRAAGPHRGRNRRGRHRHDFLHLGHHRQSQGHHADAPELLGQLPRRGRHVRQPDTFPHPAGPARGPFLRAHRGPVHGPRLRHFAVFRRFARRRHGHPAQHPH